MGRMLDVVTTTLRQDIVLWLGNKKQVVMVELTAMRGEI